VISFRYHIVTIVAVFLALVEQFRQWLFDLKELL